MRHAKPKAGAQRAAASRSTRHRIEAPVAPRAGRPGRGPAAVAGNRRKAAGPAGARAVAAEPWKLRFAVPLGFPGPDRPYFLETLGTSDPVEQIRHIAGLGLSGVQDNNLKRRPHAEQERIGKALARHGLEMGCFVNDVAGDLRWGSRDAGMIAAIRRSVQESIDAAKRSGGANIVVNSPRDPKIPLWHELATFADNLRRVRDMAEKAGVVLCLEHVNAPRMPGLLLNRLGDAYGVVRAVDSPAVKLVFDTTHVQIMDGDLSANLLRVAAEIAVVQVADVPNRFEPGTGEINFVNLFRQVRDSGFKGLVEMEHYFSIPGRAGEDAALRALKGINAAI